jgi:hypothetical protein
VTTVMTTKTAAITQTSTLRMVDPDYSAFEGPLRVGLSLR